MKTEHQQIGTVNVLTPIGALVDQEGDGFCKLLLKRIRSSNPRVVVSLREVPYFDSTTLEGLLLATEEMAENASALKLADVSPTCRETLELTGLSPRFRFFRNVQDAVKSYL